MEYKHIFRTLIASNFIIVLSAILIFAYGVVILGDNLIDDISEADQSEIDLQATIGGSIIALGIFLALVALLGFASLYIKKKWPITAYIVIIILLLLCVLVLTPLLFYAWLYVNDNFDVKKFCEDNKHHIEFMDTTDRVVKQANQEMCNTDCPCDLGRDKLPQFENWTSFVVRSDGGNKIPKCNPCISQNQKVQSELQRQRDQGLIGQDECPPEIYYETLYTSDERATFNFINEMEDRFTCAGLCETATFYLFTDVNRGPPPRSCVQDFYDWVNNRIIATWIIGLFFIIHLSVTLVFSFLLRKRIKIEQESKDTITLLMTQTL